MMEHFVLPGALTVCLLNSIILNSKDFRQFLDQFKSKLTGSSLSLYTDGKLASE